MAVLVPVVFKPVRSPDGEPFAHAVKILDAWTGEERAVVGWYETAEEAMYDAEGALEPNERLLDVIEEEEELK